jgi:hypothetical protein
LCMDNLVRQPEVGALSAELTHCGDIATFHDTVLSVADPTARAVV